MKWGDIHRAIIGKQDYAVGGANGALGVFRVLWFSPMKTDSLKLQVNGGDCWILAVEFDKVPRAYSVLSYGESNKETSPYYGDQLKLFVDKEVKKVFYTEEDIKQNTLRFYHPGQSNL
jgi:acyl-homoserine-lactone acylase